MASNFEFTVGRKGLPDLPSSAKITLFARRSPWSMQEGDVIDGRYKVQNKLGQGGMGQVFKGHDKELNLTVAIKVLFPNTPDQVIKRFHTEAKALARFNHPNIMTVKHFGQAENGQLYLVMDFIKGDSLSSMIESRGAQTYFDVLPIFEKICRGLKYAHMNQVFHRDIKPSNVMLASDRSKDDSVKLVDFGLAKQNDQSHELTKTGSAMGSPPYMSPEAVHGKETDERSDIYSLGCTFYEMMAGRPPFQGDTPFHTMMAQINRLPPSLSETSGKQYDEEVEEFIQKCLRKNPADRFQNMDELIKELDKVTKTLTEKKQASMGMLASGVYASGAFFKERARRLDRWVKGANVGGAILIVTIVAGGIWAWMQFRPGEVKEAENNTQVLAQEFDKKNSEKATLNTIKGLGRYEAGATVVEDKDAPLHKVCILSGDLTDVEELKAAVEPHKELTCFQFEDLEISKDGLELLRKLLTIQKLKVVNMDTITPELMAFIGKSNKLLLLKFDKCGFPPPKSLDNFKDLTSLNSLDMALGEDYEHPFDPLSHLRVLGAINFYHAHITAHDMETVSKMPLMALDLRYSKIDEDALAKLQSCKHMMRLCVSDQDLTLAQFKQISEVPVTSELDLHATNLTDESVPLFYKFKNLKKINFQDTKVTVQASQVLREKLPGVEILSGRKMRLDEF